MATHPPEWERGVAMGMKEAHRHLNAIRSNKANTDRVVRAYMSGLATGLMRWSLERYGSRATFDLFTGLADEALNSELEKGD